MTSIICLLLPWKTSSTHLYRLSEKKGEEGIKQQNWVSASYTQKQTDRRLL